MKSLTFAPAIVVALCLAACLARPTSAQAAGRVAHASRPVAHATAIVDHPVLDGRLDDPAWARATPVTELTQLDPEEGRPASARTEVRVVYDAEALYIGAWLHDSLRPNSRLVRRDAYVLDSDWFSV